MSDQDDDEVMWRRRPLGRTTGDGAGTGGMSRKMIGPRRKGTLEWTPPYHIVCRTGRKFVRFGYEWIRVEGDDTFEVMTSKGWLEGSGHPFGLTKIEKHE